MCAAGTAELVGGYASRTVSQQIFVDPNMTNLLKDAKVMTATCMQSSTLTPELSCVCRAPSDVEPNLDLPARLTLQRYRNEASAATYEMTAVMKELKRHKKESERVQLQQQLSIRGLKEQVNLAQQALQQQVIVHPFFGNKWSQNNRSYSTKCLVITQPNCLCNHLTRASLLANAIVHVSEQKPVAAFVFCMSICLSVCRFAQQSVRLSFCLCQLLCLSVCASLCIYPCACLSRQPVNHS